MMTLFPFTCVFCARVGQQKDLCADCERDLPWLKEACSYCANPLPQNSEQQLACGECLRHNPPFAKTIALFHYQSPVMQLLTQLKFHGQLIYAKLLGQLMANHLQDVYCNLPLPQMIIPVPLHLQRLQERGFNQALEIARPIARRLSLPLQINACQRIRATAAQSAIAAAERGRNISNAFVVAPRFFAKHVALLDDVVTTTATVTELSKVLRQQGVETIDIWCCARTHHQMVS